MWLLLPRCLPLLELSFALLRFINVRTMQRLKLDSWTVPNLRIDSSVDPTSTSDAPLPAYGAVLPP